MPPSIKLDSVEADLFGTRIEEVIHVHKLSKGQVIQYTGHSTTAQAFSGHSNVGDRGSDVNY